MDILLHKPRYDETTQTLYLNDDFSIPVSKEIWDFEIGTYRTIHQILRQYKDRPLNIEYLHKVIEFIKMTIDQVDKISSIDLIT